MPWVESYIGPGVHAASCTLAVISEAGKRLGDFPVETDGRALVEAIRMIPGHKHRAAGIHCPTGDGCPETGTGDGCQPGVLVLAVQIAPDKTSIGDVP
jgi:hypothetical protein